MGGGFRAEDYAKIKHQTDGKLIDWDRKYPPNEFIILGGGDKQYERPDVWIKPCDSVVLEIKAASVAASDQFGTNFTLRFPRFKRFRDDKTWETALSIYEFQDLKARVEAESKEKEFKVDTMRKGSKRLKRAIVIAGNESKIKTQYAGPDTEIFEGLNFYVVSEMLHPQKKSKAEIEQIIKSNGGDIYQSATAADNVICIGDRKVVKVASLIKSGHTNIVKPSWIFDAIKQSEVDGSQQQRFLIPFEPGHMFHSTEESREGIEENVDAYGDSYARDTTPDELKRLMGEMIIPKNHNFQRHEFLNELEERGKGLGELPGSMFERCVVCFVQPGKRGTSSKLDIQVARSQFLFAGGNVTENSDDEGITHYVIVDDDREVVESLRQKIAHSWRNPPRFVTVKWLCDSWEEKTLLDEERYAPTA